MKVIREKTILQEIDDEIDKKGLPDIIRIDLEEGEFLNFLKELTEYSCSIRVGFDNKLYDIKEHLTPLVGETNLRHHKYKWLGSYVVYRSVSVQCCYGE